MKVGIYCFVTLMLGMLFSGVIGHPQLTAETDDPLEQQYEKLRDEIKKGVETKVRLEESAKKYGSLLQDPYSSEIPSKSVTQVKKQEDDTPEEPTPEEVFIELPEEVQGSGIFIAVKANTNGKEVKWVKFDEGLDVFPSDLLKDSKTIVVGARKDGVYRLGAYTALGDQPSDIAFTRVIVGDGKPDPPKEPEPPADDFADTVRKWLDTVPTSAKGEAKAIAQALKEISNSADKFDTLDEIKSGLGAVLVQTIKDAPAWRSFGQSMMAYTSSLEQAGDIKTPADFAFVLGKIAEEL